MKDKTKRFRLTVGPLGMSLAAAAVTAAAFAAISLADSGRSGGGGGDIRTFQAPGPGGAGAVMMFRDDLSDADRQKLDDFRSCMEENGAPAPPEPGKFDPSNPPKPPSADDQEKLRKAWEACKDKLPEDMQKAGPPGLHATGCRPGGLPPGESGKQQNQDQSDSSSSDSSGSDS